MTITAQVVTRLTSDSALMALLTGGVFDGAIVGEITRQSAASAFDSNAEIEPCALVTEAEETAIAPYLTSARLTLSLYFYQRSGYAAIGPAAARAYALLQRTKISNAPIWQIRHMTDLHQQEDQALQCSLEISHYEVLRLR